MKKSYVFLAEGFEDIEMISIVDVLRRGGVEVQTVSISKSCEVTSAHGVTVVSDLLLNEVETENAECLVFPGGMPGAQNLGQCPPLISLMQHHYDKGGYVAAICAAPALVLSHLNAGRKLCLTCYPGFENFLPEARVVADATVVDGKVITGKGPGFAIQFSLTILEQIRSAKVAKEVAEGMLL